MSLTCWTLPEFEGTLFRGLSQPDTSLHVERVHMDGFVHAIAGDILLCPASSQQGKLEIAQGQSE